mmetsp:Transcript_8833/g.23784  ORF Transcript_8833/g.23784 Transcript_8833/m.23784 type:complete len:80 (-) Transcript_8833:1394-1633(-)
MHTRARASSISLGQETCRADKVPLPGTADEAQLGTADEALPAGTNWRTCVHGPTGAACQQQQALLVSRHCLSAAADTAR